MKKIFIAFIVLLPFIAFAEVQSGDCARAKNLTTISYNNTKYQCWYGTSSQDLMILFEDGVGIQPRDRSKQIEEISRGKFDSTKKQVLFGLGGDDEVKVFESSQIAGHLHGGIGQDEIHGGPLNDYLYGDSGNDYLYGKEGNDHLYGGSGSDFMTGYTGVNTYYKDSADSVKPGADDKVESDPTASN